MKTVTVTSQNAINYGAVLQSYALHRKLNELGIDDELLDLKTHHRVYFRKMKIGKTLPSDIYNNLINLLYINKTFTKLCRFRRFVKSNIKMTRRYKNVKELINDPCFAEIYITGGDQMFNTHNGIHPVNFLQFGDKGVRRISYATSMGTAVNEKYIKEFVSAVEKYAYVSVRESNLSDYISKLCSVPCSANIDPSLLLGKEDWEKLAVASRTYKKVLNRKYILVYPLLHNELLSNAINKLKSETGFEIVVLNPYARAIVKGDIIIRDAGPLEFLSLFKNAQFILTTSFHGVCFSIIFQKPFWTFVRKSGETRINNLLSMLNLSDRIINGPDQMTATNMHLLYTEANEIIDLERKKSYQYLTRALGI